MFILRIEIHILLNQKLPKDTETRKSVGSNIPKLDNVELFNYRVERTFHFTERGGEDI